MLPTVAIVGRTNVGKSSLFNRLVGSQQAIVAQEEGTTRDPVVGKVEHNGYNFWLVDTAGLKKATDEFEATIQDQITDAAENADVIMVMVEADLFPSDEDRRVAKQALKSKKPVILVVNKIDKSGALDDAEFMRLGIKVIIRTSAQHNRGISALADTITELIPKKKAADDSGALHLAIIGRPNVGKSSLFNALAGKQQALISQKAGTTRDVGHVQIRYHQRAVELLDTAGVRRNGKIEQGIEKFSVLRTMQAIESADICLLLMDVHELNVTLDQKLAGIIKEAGKGLIIVVTKWDSFDKDPHSHDTIAASISREYDFVPWAPLIFTSSVTGQNVTKLLEVAFEIDERRKRVIPTSQLNRVLQETTRAHSPVGFRNRPPRLRYITQTDTQPPYFSIFGNNTKFLHWSSRRQIERRLRDSFDFTGTPIKLFFRDTKDEKEHPYRAEKE